LRALVTGAAGFAGSHLCELLLLRQEEVYGLVVPGGGQENLEAIRGHAALSGCLHVRAVDILDAESLAATVADIQPERVYHLAAFPSVRQSLENPMDTFLVNTVGTRNLLEALRTSGVRSRVLVVSSAEAYGDSANLGRPLQEDDPLLPVSPYGASKAAAEAVANRYLREFSVDIVRVRPFVHTGPRQAPQFVFSDWAHQLAQAQVGRISTSIQVGNLAVWRDVLDVRDVVTAYALALERGKAGSVFNVCSGRSYSLQDILQRLIRLSGVEIQVIADSGRLRPQDLKVLEGIPDHLHTVTGWEATIPLDQTLSDLLAYCCSRIPG